MLLLLQLLSFESWHLDSVKAYEIKPSCSDIDDLKLFSLIDSCTISGLKSELPQYLAASEDVRPATDKLQWWRRHANEFPFWSNVCKNDSPNIAILCSS